MFKKPKINNSIPPPTAPSLDDILCDLETFQVDIEPRFNNKSSEPFANTIDDWWPVFEQFTEDLKCLEMVNKEIEGVKLKLESLKIEIDTEWKLLKHEINQNQHLMDVALEL